MVQHAIVVLGDDDFEVIEDDLGDLPELVDTWAAELVATRRFEEQQTQVWVQPHRARPRATTHRYGRVAGR